jgi:hypothetical protein
MRHLITDMSCICQRSPSFPLSEVTDSFSLVFEEAGDAVKFCIQVRLNTDNPSLRYCILALTLATPFTLVCVGSTAASQRSLADRPVHRQYQ